MKFQPPLAPPSLESQGVRLPTSRRPTSRTYTANEAARHTGQLPPSSVIDVTFGVLHEITEDGGLGFCHAALPGLLPRGYHGPLVVALDSNALIDLQQHGNLLLNDDLPDVDDAYAGNLAGLTELLNLWLLRDIRFVVTPRSLTDAKKLTQRFLDRRLPAVEAIAESLAFQFGDWTATAPSHGKAPATVGEETGLPDGADRDLIVEAQAVGAHAFLTRDQLVLKQVSLSGPAMAVIAPRALAVVLVGAGAQPFFGGTCGAADCPYGDWPLPAPDMGKWSGLLSIFEE